MKSLRWIVSIASVFLLIIGCLLWWNRPRPVDMALYAPADSVAYLESNSLLQVARSISSTDAWLSLRPFIAAKGYSWNHPWLQSFCSWTGIGPTRMVILTRAQVAIAVIEVGTTAEAETVKIKPEAAILVETHTAQWRVKPALELLLKKFAADTYGQPIFQRTQIDGAEFIEWLSPKGDRRIVAVLNGTLVIIGNTEHAVRSCLGVRLGQRPSLRETQELQQMRQALHSDASLAFGYISSKSAARLLSLGAPLLFGQPPGNPQFEHLLASGAAKILGSVGWSACPALGGIEDHYLFSLQAPIVSRLKPVFKATATSAEVLKVLPTNFESLTIYKYQDPAAVWNTFEMAISSQLDTLSAVIFDSMVKSALLPYGIEKPEEFLHKVGPELLTMRIDQETEHSLLIAAVDKKTTLQQVATKELGGNQREERIGEIVVAEAPEKSRAVTLINGYLLTGSSADVRRCAQVWSENRTGIREEKFKPIFHFVPLSSMANILSYTNDVARVRTFLYALGRAQGVTDPSNLKDGSEQALAALPYAASQTILADQGLERTTRSCFGQFSVLLSLLFPAPEARP